MKLKVMAASKVIVFALLSLFAACLSFGCHHVAPPSHIASKVMSHSKSNRPDGADFWAQFELSDDDHLGAGYPREVWNRVGGSLGSAGAKGNWLPCAGRLSYALDHSGQPVPAISHVTYRNSDGLHYILRASDMRKYLHRRWGKPDFAGFGVYKCVPYSPQFLNSLHLGNSVAIFATNGHVGVIKAGYDDPLLPTQGAADIWILPS